MGSEASDSVRRSVNVTIERLQRSSPSAHSLGQRYARLLALLWRSKTGREAQDAPPRHPTAAATATEPTGRAVGVGAVADGEEARPGPAPYSAAGAAPCTADANDAGAAVPGGGAQAGHPDFGAVGRVQAPAGVPDAVFIPQQPGLGCRGFSWRDLDDLGQFIGPTDVDFSDPAHLGGMGGGVSLDGAAAFDVLWPGTGAAFL